MVAPPLPAITSSFLRATVFVLIVSRPAAVDLKTKTNANPGVFPFAAQRKCGPGFVIATKSIFPWQKLRAIAFPPHAKKRWRKQFQILRREFLYGSDSTTLIASYKELFGKYIDEKPVYSPIISWYFQVFQIGI